MTIGFLIFTALLSSFALLLSWKGCIKLALLLAVIEGALRKWVFVDSSDYAYFLKDAILLLGYAKYLNTMRPSQQTATRTQQVLYVLALITLGVCSLEVLNPRSGSLGVSLFGLRSYLLYLPLLFLGARLFETRDELHTFFRHVLYTIFPLSALALAQYSLPPTAAINRYAWNEGAPEVATIMNNVVRATATFSYVAGFSSFLIICFCFVLPLFFWDRLPLSRVGFLSTVFLLTLVSLLMTGSRGPAVDVIIIVTLFFTVNTLCGHPREMIPFFIPVVFSSLLLPYIFSAQLDRFLARVQAHSDLSERIGDEFLDPVRFASLSGFSGYGIGATHQAAQKISEQFHQRPDEEIPIYYESETGRIMLELGIIGFVIWYGFRAFIALNLIRLYFRTKDRFLKQVALSVGLTHLAVLTTFLVFSNTFGIFFWLTASMVLLIPRLDQHAMREGY